MKTIVSSLLLLLFGYSTSAQLPQDFRVKYNREVITVLTPQKFMVGEKTVSRKAIRERLLKYPESAAEYKLFQKNRKIANALAWTSIGAYVTSFVLLGSNDGAAAGTFLGAFVVSMSGVPFDVKARKHLLQSVYLYNREVLANP